MVGFCRLQVLLVLVGGTLAFHASMAAESHFVSVWNADKPASNTHASMVQRIDEQLRSAWTENAVEPAERATDSEFLRRASLDLTGVIPRVSDVRKFLSDGSPEKRTELIRQLLNSPRSATHLATVWHNRILPAGAEEMHPVESQGLQKWLRTKFANNTRYDNLVAGLLLASGNEELGPALYFRSHDVAPEKIAASVSELFLGVKLQCAQCHDHPYSEYSQRDFWGLAAFFAQVRAPEQRGMTISFRLTDENHGEVRFPDSEEIVAPKYLRVNDQVDESLGSRRASLVLWLTSRDNDYFARAGVNWAWTHLFGQPLMESLDEVTSQHNQTNHQLLEELTDYFVASGFDLRQLLVTLASTEAYQRAGWSGGGEPPSSHLFAVMAPKSLSPEQLYDSFLLLAPRALNNYQTPADEPNAAVVGMAADPMRIQFVRRMREPPGSPTEYRAGTLQALMLMNGTTTAELTDRERSRLLGALTAPFMSDEDRVEALFLATLCREPDFDERAMALKMLEKSDDQVERNRVLSDLLWALLNSTEFAFNR